MQLYSSNDDYKLYEGSMLDMLDIIEPNTIDSIITDPPYELNFMGKGWDNSGIAFQPDTWKKCYEVLKPGGYLLAFGGSRTFHRIAVAIEDAGFEIKDTIMWLYGQGMPKGMNIGLALDKRHGVDNRTGNVRTDGKGTDSGSNIYNSNNGSSNMTKEYEERVAQNEWKGWNTQLKPSYEPIIVARKPFKGSLLDNIEEFGVGGINIDECRVNLVDDKDCTATGRFPANTIITYDETLSDDRLRYFYCAKASKKDRDEGLDGIEATVGHAKGNGLDRVCEFCGVSILTPELCHCETKSWVAKPKKNSHPTVKPTDLMQYLIRLVTPNGGTILDPFNGSGSTGKAAMYENKEKNKGYKYIGIEITPEYLPISKARIEYVCDKVDNETL